MYIDTTNKEGWIIDMETLNSYFGMGMNDYLYAKGSMATSREIGNYNGTAALCSQSGEKFLKAVIEKCFADEDSSELIPLLRTHNLRTLYNKITTKYNLATSSKDCKWLGDFYFDARYPGDNFVLVTEKDALECLAILEMIKTDTEKLLDEEETRRNAARDKVKTLKCF